MNWLRVFEGRRIWLEAASVPGFRRSAERCAQKNCPIRANPNYDEIALPVPTFGHSGLPANRIDAKFGAPAEIRGLGRLTAKFACLQKHATSSCRTSTSVSYTHLRAHETDSYHVC